MNIRKLLIGLVTLMLILAGCGSGDNNDNNNNNNDNNNQNEVNDTNNNEDNNNLNDEDNNDNGINNEDNNDNDDENNTNNEENADSAGDGGTETFGQLSYTVPEGAEVVEVEDQGMPVILYMLDEATGTSFNIVEEELPEDMDLSLDEYMEFAVEGGEASGIEYETPESIEVNGKEWNELYGVSQGFPILQRTAIYNNVAYVFTLSSGNEDVFDKHIDTLKEITESVEETN